MAVTIDGTETDEQVRGLPKIDPICALLNIAAGTSRVHASRRIFHIIKSHDIETPVIHHRVFDGSPHRDEIAILTGSEIGGLLVDGLGDGVMLDVPTEDFEMLRTTSFGLLQVCQPCIRSDGIILYRHNSDKFHR
jgi:(E)-4-hydroxy-3-methylbut-2-enyl-diphosphate synthase